jgi:hypothetical protein
MKKRNGIFTSVNPGFRFGKRDGGDAANSIFDINGKYCVILVFCTCLGCRKPYDPPAITASSGYLVVEGSINPGADSTSITLSHTVNISSKVTVNPVTGASVSVLRDDNVAYPLTEAGNGTYTSPGLNLDNLHKYKLSIKTSDGKQYLSDPEPVLATPPIDSIGYNIVMQHDTGIQIYANTHDPSGTIKYYRWDYSENWEFHARYGSTLISDGYALVGRGPDQDIYKCYTSDVSSNIVLGSSARLSQPVIYQSPIVFLPSTSEKLEDRYRIVVRQYALSGSAYDFWLNLKKNTEQLGSIFDAQPSQAPGNVHCVTNPLEPVVGYVSVCTISVSTIFIYNNNLPAWAPAYPYPCSLDTAKTGTQEVMDLINYPTVNFVINAYAGMYGSGYLYTDRQCADCTIRGTVTPPPFWR